jgi:hypothetical protein
MVVIVCGIADIVISVAAKRAGWSRATTNQKAPIKQALSDFRNAIRFSKTHFVCAPRRYIELGCTRPYSGSVRVTGINAGKLIVRECSVALAPAAKLELSTPDLAEAIAAVSKVYCPHEVKILGSNRGVRTNLGDDGDFGRARERIPAPGALCRLLSRSLRRISERDAEPKPEAREELVSSSFQGRAELDARNP